MTSLTVNRLVENLKAIVFIGSMAFAVASSGMAVVYSFLWPLFIERLRVDLDIATKQDINTLYARLDHISGDDKIVKMIPNHSYVKEPAFVGDDIIFVMTAQRSKKGENCIFKAGVPLYVDQRNIPFAGELLQRSTQLTTSPTRLQLNLSPPGNLMPGRVGIYLSLQYDCPHGSNESMINVFEDTSTVFFELSPSN